MRRPSAARRPQSCGPACEAAAPRRVRATLTRQAAPPSHANVRYVTASPRQPMEYRGSRWSIEAADGASRQPILHLLPRYYAASCAAASCGRSPAARTAVYGRFVRDESLATSVQGHSMWWCRATACPRGSASLNFKRFQR